MELSSSRDTARNCITSGFSWSCLRLGAFIKGTNFEPPDRVLKAVLDAFAYSRRKRSTFLSYFEKILLFY